MSSLQEQLIRDLDRNRRGYGDPGSNAVLWRTPTCGDEVALHVAIEGGVIRSFVWRGHGCTVSMASTSALAELVDGMPVEHLAAARARFAESLQSPSPDEHLLEDGPLGSAVVFAGIGRLPLRTGCALLCWDALAAALARSAVT